MPAAPKTPLTHGTLAMYRKKCRCPECTAAKREVSRQYWRDKYSGGRRNGSLAVRACVVCSASFNPRANQITCSTDCRKVHLGRLGDHRSRATHFGVAYERLDRLEIFERDAWTCGICELPVDQGLAFPDPGSPTLDHVVPMSRGGGHVQGNVQLAHFYCNTVKGNREVASC